MRILLAHSFYRISGGEDACVRQQLDLLRRRHETALIGRHNRELGSGVSVAARMLFSQRTQTSVENAITAFHPDLIHLHNAYPALGPAVFLAAGRLQVPLVMTVHNYRLRCPNGYMFTEDEICTRCEGGMYQNAVLHRCFATKSQAGAYAVSLWIHRFILDVESKVSLFVCPSEFMHRTLQRWGVPEERMRVIRNFPQPVPDGNPSPGKYGAYVGRLSREKGVHVLLEALKLAGDPLFKVVGEGPEDVALRQQASQLGLMNTTFSGHATVDEVDRTLRGARFLVLPSLWNENAPLAAMEAMARGRPLIASAVGGLPELAREGRGSIVVPGDRRDLARSISNLMRDTEGCRLAGAAAIAFAEEELTPERHLARLERAYRDMIAASSRP
jgi:glycosyltransferase involved in cell wall biosynthesis